MSDQRGDPAPGREPVGRRVLVLNGPNLGRLGTREPDTYGHTTHDDLARACHEVADRLGLAVEVRQTDAEHQMLAWLHESADHAIPVVLNPAAWTHYSVAVADAVAQRTAPLVEVHISNVHAREEFRRHSYITPYASGVIAGLGVDGYRLALEWVAHQLEGPA